MDENPNRFNRLRAWCRRNPALAAQVALIAGLLIILNAASILFAIRFAQLKHENEELRRELESVHASSIPKPRRNSPRPIHSPAGEHGREPRQEDEPAPLEEVKC